MKEVSYKFLSALFDPGEEVCFSPNKYAYKSIPWQSLGPDMILESQGENVKEQYRFKRVSEDQIISVGINPIKGDKADANVTAYRTFLIEIDDGDVYQQKEYIEALKMPYTVCVFSGNKSLHYGITLNTDLPSEVVWRDFNEWILRIVSRADQQNKNPTKSIRFPGNKRPDGKRLFQTLVDIRDRVDVGVLTEWLNRYPSLNPIIEREERERQRKIKLAEAKYNNGEVYIPTEMIAKLRTYVVGSKRGRNNEWWGHAKDLANIGYDEDTIESLLEPYFYPESDFSYNEWKGVIKSAVRASMR